MQQLKSELNSQQYLKAEEIFGSRNYEKLDKVALNRYQEKIIKYFAYVPKKLFNKITEPFKNGKYKEIIELKKKLCFGNTITGEKNTLIKIIKL